MPSRTDGIQSNQANGNHVKEEEEGRRRLNRKWAILGVTAFGYSVL